MSKNGNILLMNELRRRRRSRMTTMQKCRTYAHTQNCFKKSFSRKFFEDPNIFRRTYVQLPPVPREERSKTQSRRLFDPSIRTVQYSILFLLFSNKCPVLQMTGWSIEPCLNMEQAAAIVPVVPSIRPSFCQMVYTT